MARTKQTARNVCYVCLKFPGKRYIRCSSCRGYYHYDCIKLTIIPESFTCQLCIERQAKGENIETCDESDDGTISDLELNSDSSEIQAEPDTDVVTIINTLTDNISEEAEHVSELEDNDGSSFDVKSIQKYRKHNNKREFLIEWTTSESTWEPENNLDGCVTLLKEFIDNYNANHVRKIPQTTIKSRYGDRVGNTCSKSGVSEANENWVTIDQIISSIVKWRNYPAWNCLKSNLPIIELSDFKQGDEAIVLIKSNNHCFVVLTFNSGVGYIADGNNLYLDDYDARTRINSIANGLDLFPIRTGFSAKSDRCGSAAVLIALEFGRIYDGKPIMEIKPNKTLRERVQKELHPKVSRGTDNIFLSGLSKSLLCKHCNKVYPNGSQRKLTMHIRMAHKD